MRDSVYEVIKLWRRREAIEKLGGQMRSELNKDQVARLRSEFNVLRSDVDCASLCDTFDLVLGWLLGKGFPHEIASELAGEWS
jgi:phosphoglycolate phosphatase-like HAD superfamily hydrolase